MATLDFVQVDAISRSVFDETGLGIDTLRLTYPRMVHADFMTHRVFSRNASSSRAIPLKKMLLAEAYVPSFRQNQPGMQPGAYLAPAKQAEAERVWNEMADFIRERVAYLGGKEEEGGLNIHKQWVNRATEWFGYITVVVTATDYVNFLGLRDHEAAQDEIQALAARMKAVLEETPVKTLRRGEWHLPFVTDEDLEEFRKLARDMPGGILEVLGDTNFAFRNFAKHGHHRYTPDHLRLALVASAARCARTSYLDFDGSKASIIRDAGTFLKLAGSQPVHASPLEHQASPARQQSFLCGNFEGWDQFRKMVPGERIISR